MDVQATIDEFLSGQVYAVAGASRDRRKYGNKVLRCYLQKDLIAWPVHPSEEEVEGVPCTPDLASLPEPVHGLSIVTPPEVTEELVVEAAVAGIKHIWIQPGAESHAAISKAKDLGLNVIAGGPCVLVALGYEER
jgi:predicted CoA-binding protein